MVAAGDCQQVSVDPDTGPVDVADRETRWLRQVRDPVGEKSSTGSSCAAQTVRSRWAM